MTNDQLSQLKIVQATSAQVVCTQSYQNHKLQYILSFVVNTTIGPWTV